MTSLQYYCITGLTEIKTYAQKMQDAQVTKSLHYRSLIVFIINGMFISDCYNYACAFSDWLQLTLQRPPFSRIYSQSLFYMGSLTTEVLKNSMQIQTLNTTFFLHQNRSDSTMFAAQIKCHSETLDHFRGKKIMRDRKNEASAERL